jgi:hypothetical protein
MGNSNQTDIQLLIEVCSKKGGSFGPPFFYFLTFENQCIIILLEISEKVQKSLITSIRNRLHRYDLPAVGRNALKNQENLCNPLLTSV